ncbi:uncharacterized protein LOC118484335 isoform X1 [Helianthus annuus]|uniref:uncharacterized protein LOC118484335 isoform X1 n=1 Tax=Helianthus annuus TaxID=4232 RepID=UPI001652F3E8|nr:uncharacterized protein LOC118484335 isoform X1 [Helianthus annuus]
MSYSGYSPAPSATFERSPSIDPTKHVSYASEPTAPTASSVHNGRSEPQLTATSQSLVPPGQEDVRQLMKSANQISDSGLNSTSFGQPPGRSGEVHNIMSANEVTGKVASEAKAPTFTPIVERDQSNKGLESNEAEGDNDNQQQEHVGVSMVGKKFKPVNPEAYYVEDEDDDDEY